MMTSVSELLMVMVGGWHDSRPDADDYTHWASNWRVRLLRLSSLAAAAAAGRGRGDVVVVVMIRVVLQRRVAETAVDLTSQAACH